MIGKSGGRIRKINSPSHSANRQILSWAIYDWANSAFATTVMAGFFPLFFKQYWSAGTDVTQSTTQLALTNSLSGLIIAVLAPILGALADHGLGKKRFLGTFTVLGSLATAALFWVPQGDWLTAALWYGLASMAFSGALVFYDSMLVDVSEPQQMDRVSSLGYSLGYLGGGILFLLNVLMYLKPNWFGIADAVTAVRWSFLSVAVWWLVFSWPLALWVRERSTARPLSDIRTIAKSGWLSFLRIVRELRRHRPLLLFILAYLIYIDGVNTVIKMAVDYGMSIGLNPSDLITALLIVQFLGFPAAYGFGMLAQKISNRACIFICLWVYGLITLFAFFLSNSTQFYFLAAMIALVQGGIQALSRSIFAQMIPQNESSEYFGFFNLLGKFSAIIGPLLVGLASWASGDPRWSMVVILTMFVGGGLLLKRVDTKYRVLS